MKEAYRHLGIVTTQTDVTLKLQVSKDREMVGESLLFWKPKLPKSKLRGTKPGSLVKSYVFCCTPDARRTIVNIQ